MPITADFRVKKNISKKIFSKSTISVEWLWNQALPFLTVTAWTILLNN